MNIKYGGSMSNVTFQEYCETYLVNKIFKILPLKEGNKEWESYVESLNKELIGASVLISNQYYFGLVSKLEGLRRIEDDALFRKTIFECISYAKLLPSKMGED